jgi:hypothetical protein
MFLQKEINMADENTIDYPALCEELSARVTELEAALSEEQDKNAVLVQQVVEAEDTIANREVESFADVIDPEDKEFFRERLIENRDATLAVLNRMRAKRSVPAEKETTPEKGKPLHNRSAAPDPAPRQGEEMALKLRNRAQEIVKRDGCGYLVAFRRAEVELSIPKGE